MRKFLHHCFALETRFSSFLAGVVTGILIGMAATFFEDKNAFFSYFPAGAIISSATLHVVRAGMMHRKKRKRFFAEITEDGLHLEAYTPLTPDTSEQITAVSVNEIAMPLARICAPKKQ